KLSPARTISPTGGFAIRLHKKGEPATYTSCGNIPAKANAITVPLQELNSSGQSGVATLVAVGDKTAVAVYATAEVSELNHIHSGTCAVVGPVVHPFPNMVGGITATELNAKLDTLQTGGFAIRLHKKGAPAIYTACGNIPAKSTASSGTTPTAFQVTITNMTLLNITIPVGATVNWVNGDTVPHILGSGKDGKLDAAGWKSPTLNAGQSYSQTFTSTGTFPYTCSIHPSMNATVTVAQAGTPSSSTPTTSGDTPGGGSDYNY
ncbi:MAG: plastocyanin/azurin family copper-binding protein, partial [Chloroflexota bacterium]